MPESDVRGADPHRLRSLHRAAAARTTQLPWRHFLLMFLALLVVFGLGIGLYVNERLTRERTLTVGAAEARNRIEVEATVHGTDAQKREVTLRLTAEPQGLYADSDGGPRKELKIITNAPDAQELTFPTDGTARLRDLTLPLRQGTVSDYPFDRYESLLAVGAMLGGDEVPVVLNFRDQNANFVYGTRTTGYSSDVAHVTSKVSRSRSTFIMAWFMMGAMWAIALSVVLACWLVVRQGRGLLWAALGWFAASLFALVGLRNAAPGSPPNGCLLDYAAFYWAEALIALALTRLVFHGISLEHRLGGPASPASADETARPRGLHRRRVQAGSRVRRPRPRR
ncbi:DUF4436 family protein [Streptomyces sp. KLOTTS4A1]|uniref:DUF4436 family protein n=1 Tax=Streptomyces sp. KLOTTS4A1 TaxID=3390996 RepID=UPI0039F5C251